MNCDELAFNAITRLRDSHPLDEPTADYGPWAEFVEAIAAAPPAQRRQVVDELAQRDPALMHLLANFTPRPEIPPVFEQTPGPLPLNQILKALQRGEVGDAALLAEMVAGRIAYDHAEKEWYLWAGHCWVRDNRHQIGRLVTNDLAAQYLHAAAEQQKSAEDEADKQLVKKLTERARLLCYRNKLNNVLDMASRHQALALSGQEWAPDPWLLPVANGVIELRTGACRPGRPGDFIRRCAPTAWSGLKAEAPRWQQFLAEIFAGDGDMIAFMQRLLGYALTGLSTEHILPVLWGQGRNGKDTLLETLAYVLGDLAAPVSRDVMLDSGRHNGNATPHLYNLRHLRLAWVNESGEGHRFNSAQVKQLTGGGTITARPLYGQPITFTPQFLLLLVTNHKPPADEDDYGLWKRLQLVSFSQSFVDQPRLDHEHPRDPHLIEKLKAEAPGILAWLVAGCLAWQAQGLNPPPTVTGATEAYQQEQDLIGQFIADCCVIHPEARIRGGPLYEAFVKWYAQSYGTSDRPMSGAMFGRKMGKRFAKDKNPYVVYRGLGLKAEDEAEE